ncbi:MAG: hypothetical protein J5658_03670 [Prevotella sp.]|nr:hypothetical protein [Prevotella sp.]
MMWKTVSVVSQSVESGMPPEERDRLKKKIYAMLSGGHYEKEFAMETVDGMYYIDKAGNEHRAPFWDTDTILNIYEDVKNKIPNYNCWDFYVALNMVASDNWCLLNKWFPEMDDEERDAKMVEMTVNWLDDPDNPFGNEKAWGYFNH